jgi:hypothetical protein
MMCTNVQKIWWVPSRRREDNGLENGKKSNQISNNDICLPPLYLLLILWWIQYLVLLLAWLCLLLMTFAYLSWTYHLFYVEFNIWYYCWRVSVSCCWHLLTADVPVTYFMVNSIPGIIAGVTLSLADKGERHSYGCVPKPSNLKR